MTTLHVKHTVLYDSLSLLHEPRREILLYVFLSQFSQIMRIDAL